VSSLKHRSPLAVPALEARRPVFVLRHALRSPSLWFEQWQVQRALAARSIA